MASKVRALVDDRVVRGRSFPRWATSAGLLLVLVSPGSHGFGQTAPTCDGTFHRIPVQPPGSYLNNVQVFSPDDVWVVGSDQREQALAAHWDGVEWTKHDVPSPGRESAFQEIVGTAGDLWTVGSFYRVEEPSPRRHILVVHFDGAEWTKFRVPATRMDNNRLSSLAFVAPDDIWAVGRGESLPDTRALALHWNGSVWEKVTVPNPRGGDALVDVVAVGPSDVWAVGSGRRGPLAMHWDGSSWTVVPTPTGRDSTYSALNAVTQVGSDRLWAVGQGESGKPFVLHWDGAVWARQPTPDPEGDDYMHEVSAVSSTDVWAVGETAPVFSGGWRPVALHWDGSRWVRVRVDTTEHSSLRGVQATGSDVWAVGLESRRGQVRSVVQVAC